jgi:hypothetical protein
MGQPDFWNDPEKAKSTVGELKILKAQLEPIQTMLAGIDDVRALCQLAEDASWRSWRSAAKRSSCSRCSMGPTIPATAS